MNHPPTRRDLLKLAALAPLAGLASIAVTSKRRAKSGPNVLIIVLDALAAKHISLYGYPRQTMPNLARMAERATVFNRHYATGNFTTSGTSSLLTGALPWTQRAFNLQGTVSPPFARKNIFRVFKEAGYHTVVYTHNYLVGELLGQFLGDIDYWKPIRDLCLFDIEVSDRVFPGDHKAALPAEKVLGDMRTFGSGSLFLSQLRRPPLMAIQAGDIGKYQDQFPRGLPSNNETALFILEDAIDWIKSDFLQGPRPYFGYFHVLPPHAPFRARREFIGRFDGDGYQRVRKPAHPLGGGDSITDELWNAYDEFIAYTDSEFGRLYDALQSAGAMENTVLVVTSDHGELQERRTIGHINPLLYEPLIHIPLLIAKPGQKDRVDVSTPTSNVDLLPSLAHAAGLSIPDWTEGLVLPTFRGSVDSERSVYAIEAKSNVKQAPLTKATLAIVKGDYKLIHYRGYGGEYDEAFELYDLKKNPEELKNLYSPGSETASQLKAELYAKIEESNRRIARSG